MNSTNRALCVIDGSAGVILKAAFGSGRLPEFTLTYDALPGRSPSTIYAPLTETVRLFRYALRRGEDVERQQQAETRHGQARDDGEVEPVPRRDFGRFERS